MELVDYILQEPKYGWCDKNKNLVKPTIKQIFNEFFYRINIFRDLKNWLPLLGWFWLFCFIPFIIYFVYLVINEKQYYLIAIVFLYGLVFMASHGTLWYHRYCTHRAFEFKNNFWRFITKNLVLSVVPEEVYVISHHVHHTKSDQPGDPYNAFCGFLYCFLADVNHQLINRNLSKEDYEKASKLMNHTGCKVNTYEEYKKYGNVVSPRYIFLNWILNWTFWGLVFYGFGELLNLPGGGISMLVACFAGVGLWSIGIRTFNYEGHSKGKGEKGWGKSDFNKSDYSINQIWPGYVAGEWHNNHHLFPTSARSGFLNYQIDIPWYMVKIIHFLGGIKKYNDSKKEFIENHYLPKLSKSSLN